MAKETKVKDVPVRVGDGGVVIDPERERTKVPHWVQRVRLSTVNPFGARPARVRCDEVLPALVIAGSGRTGNNGVWALKLDSVFCSIGEDGLVLGQDPSIVATPHGKTPSFLTTSFSGTNSKLKIEVRSWLANSQIARDISFSWHCILLLQIVVP